MAAQNSLFLSGPSELSIAHPEAVQAIYGPLSRCYKFPWYDQGMPAESLHRVRDSKLHSQRRKIWDLGFSTKGKFVCGYSLMRYLLTQGRTPSSLAGF